MNRRESPDDFAYVGLFSQYREAGNLIDRGANVVDDALRIVDMGIQRRGNDANTFVGYRQHLFDAIDRMNRFFDLAAYPLFNLGGCGAWVRNRDGHHIHFEFGELFSPQQVAGTKTDHDDGDHHRVHRRTVPYGPGYDRLHGLSFFLTDIPSMAVAKGEMTNASPILRSVSSARTSTQSSSILAT